MAINEKNSVGENKKRVTPLKVVLYSFLGVLFALVLFLGIIVVGNWDLISYAIRNSSSITMALTKSHKEIENLNQANKQNQADALGTDKDTIDKLDDPELTDDEREALIYEALAGANGTQKDGDGEAEEQPDLNTELENEADGNNEQSDENKPSTETHTPDTEKEEPSSENAEGDSDVKDDTAVNPPAQNDEPVPDTKPEPEKSEPSVPAQPEKEQKPVENTDGKLSEDEYNRKVAELVAKMYSIKSDFVSKLNSFEARIKAEYKALPKEQQTMATKARIVSENMAYIGGLEASCDAQVKAVTDELTRIMTANGKDTALVQQIKQAYEDEKELKKAYYMSLYK